MPNLTYTGRADVREFTAADFKRLGVEDAKKTTFHNGEAVEVDEAVAEVLIGSYPDDFSTDEVEDGGTARALTDTDVTEQGGRRTTSGGTGGPTGTASTAGDAGTGAGTGGTGGRGRGSTRGGGSTATSR